VAAERQGVRAAAYFWVGSETDWHGVGATYRKTPFSPDVPEREKVDQILAWLDLPASERPGLILSWWHGADSAGHRHGPDDERVAEAMREQDAELARLLAGLDARHAWDETTLLVVSDHGMIGVREGIDVGAALDEAGIGGRTMSGGAYALVYLDDPSETPRAVARLRALEGIQAWPSAEVPPHLHFRHPTRTGQVVALTEPPRMLSRGSSRLNRWRQIVRLFGGEVGTHGYDVAAHPEMAAILLALGRGVAAGTRLGRVETVDVAPTVAALLGIDPPRDAEGAPIAEIGGDPRRADDAEPGGG
jgi:predicted AlkP superfamily pyrophosphatase or phosphodiesterase